MENDMRFDKELLILYQSMINEEFEQNILTEIFRTDDKNAILKKLIDYYNKEQNNDQS